MSFHDEESESEDDMDNQSFAANNAMEDNGITPALSPMMGHSSPDLDMDSPMHQNSNNNNNNNGNMSSPYHEPSNPYADADEMDNNNNNVQGFYSPQPQETTSNNGGYDAFDCNDSPNNDSPNMEENGNGRNSNNMNNINEDGDDSDRIWLDLMMNDNESEMERVYLDGSNGGLTINSTFNDLIEHMKVRFDSSANDWGIYEPDFAGNNSMEEEKDEASLREEYAEKYNLDLNDMENNGIVFASKHDPEEILCNGLKNFFNRRLQIQMESFEIWIFDKNNKFPMDVCESQTIGYLKEQIRKEKGLTMEKLLNNGHDLSNDLTLSQFTSPNNKLYGEIIIRIEDSDCQVSSQLAIYQNFTILDVLNEYCKFERREKHASSELHFNGEKISEELSATVHDKVIKNNSMLEYRVGSYFVNIYDSDKMPDANFMKLLKEDEMNRQARMQNNDNNNKNDYRNQGNSMFNNVDYERVEVFDWWTIAQVKDAYSRITRLPFMEGERVLCGNSEMEDNIPLWKLKIKDDENFMIERETQDKATEYICSDCGSIVKLRKFDSVKCRECFNQIVFKKRTQRVCQYNCR